MEIELTSDGGYARIDAIAPTIYRDENGICAIMQDGPKTYAIYDEKNPGGVNTILAFQNGPAHESVNGISNEAVIAVLRHRIGMLNTIVPSEFNITAITHLGLALEALEQRTAQRKLIGIEGTML